MKPVGMFERMTMAEAKAARLESMLLRQAQDIQILQAQVARLSSTAAAEQIEGRAPALIAKTVRRMADIAAEVATENLLTVPAIRAPSKLAAIAHPRQEAMLRMIEAGFSTPQIGRFFGKDHTTVIHGARAAKARREAVANG